MGVIIKIHDEKDHVDYYMDWSPVVDAPLTYGMSFIQFVRYYKEQYGKRGEKNLRHRLARVRLYGTSMIIIGTTISLEINQYINLKKGLLIIPL